MPNVLDDNVVILRFDNSDFEKNTKQSMNTLDKLKSSVNKTSGESLDSLGKAANKIDLGGLGKAVDTINKRFSMFGIAGMATINRLTNTAITSATKMVTAIPRQAIQGGWQRALNIEQAKNLIDGLGYAWDENSEKFEDGMKTVKTAVDNAVTGTRYALDEAALVASQLLSSGVEDTEKLEYSLKSISGLASVLNADYGDIGRIFAQVAGQGRMMGDDLLQLQQKGIGAADYIAKYLADNKEVAKAALDSAIAQGRQVKKMQEIRDHAEITGADVRDMVSAGAINFDILSASFNKLFDQAEKANDTYTGSLANLKSAVNRVGESFMKIKLENMTYLFNALIPIVKRFKVLLDPLAEKVATTANAFSKFVINGIINPFGQAIGAEKLFDKLGWAAKDAGKKIDDANKSNQKSSSKSKKEILALNKEYQAARDIWYKGTYGNGERRKNALEKIGISYKGTQAIVNQFYKDGFKWDKIEKQLVKDYNDKAAASEKAGEQTAKSNEQQTKQYPPMIALIKGFINILTAAKLALQGIFNILKFVGGKIKQALIPGVKAGINGFSSFSEKVLDAAKKFNEFSTTITDAEKRTAWLQNHRWIDAFANAISTGFSFAKDAIVGFVDVIKEFFSKFSASEGFNALKEQLKGLLDVFRDFAGGALDKVTGQLDRLSGIGASSNMDKIVNFFSGLAGGLANMIAAVRRGENPLRGFVDIIGTVKDSLSFKSLKAHGISAGINVLSTKNGTIATVVNATKALKGVNVKETFGKAADSIFNFFDGLTNKVKNVDIGGKIKSIFEALKNANWKEISKVAFYFGSLAAIIKTVRDTGRLVDAAVGTLGSISGMFKSISNVANTYAAEVKVKNFHLIAISVAILIGSMIALAAVPADKLKPAVASVVIVLGMLAGIMALMTKKLDPTAAYQVGVSFAAMGASMLLIATACKVFAGIDGPGLLKAAAAIIGFMAMMAVVSKMSRSLISSGLVFISMAAAVNLLVVAVMAFAIIPWSVLLKGAAAIAMFILELSIGARIAGSSNVTGLLAMAVALNLLIPAIIIFATMPLKKALKGATIACGIITMIGLAARIAGSSEKSTLSVISLATMVTALTASMVILSMIDTKRLITASSTLTATMLSLAAAAKFASTAKAGLALMSLAIGMITASVIALIKIDAKEAIAVTTSLATLALGLAVAFKLFGSLGVQGNLIGAAALIVAVGVVTGIVAALGKLYESETARTLMANGKKMAILLGDAIGGFFGSIYGSFGEAASSHLPAMGSNISTFAKNLKPFLEMVKGVDKDTVASAKDLANAILQLTAADFLESLSIFSGFEDLAARMQALGDGFAAFSVSINKIPDDTIDKTKTAAEVVKTLAGAFGEMPKTGGIAQKFTGEVDYKGFIQGILSVAKALGDNGNLTGLNELEIPDDLLGKKGKITKIAKVISTMASAVEEIPETGGWEQKFTGEHDVVGLAKGILAMAIALGSEQEGLNSLATITIPDGLTDKNGPITKICKVIAALSEAAKLIPESGGVKQFFTGNTTIYEFANQLMNSIQPLNKFILAMANKDLKIDDAVKEKILRVAEGVGAMATASQELSKVGGIAAWVVGEKDISDFADKLKNSIPGLQGFASGLSGLNFPKGTFTKNGKLSHLVTVIKAMAEAADVLDKTGGKWQVLTGEKDLGDFGSQLEALLGSLADVDWSKVKKIDKDSLSNAADALNTIGPSVKNFQVLGKIPTGANLVKLGQNAASFAQSLGSADTKNLASKASAIRSAAKKMGSAAKSGAESLGKTEGFSTAGSTLGNDFVKGLKDKAASAKKAGASLAKQAKSGAGSVSLNKTGKDVGDGFVKGIESKKQAAYDAGAALGYKAKAGAKKAVESESPSKEFIKIGKFIGEGLVIGMKSYERKVYKKGEDVGTMSIKGTQDGIANTIGDLMDPVITPVVDLSKVDRGLSLMDNEFSRQRALGFNSTFEPSDYKTNKMMNDVVNSLNKLNDNKQPSSNYFTFNVDGAENPEDFAKRFVRQVELEMRTG